MAIRVIFDASWCQGYANCLIEAPQVWDFDEDRDVVDVRKPGDPRNDFCENAAPVGLFGCEKTRWRTPLRLNSVSSASKSGRGPSGVKRSGTWPISAPRKRRMRALNR